MEPILVQATDSWGFSVGEITLNVHERGTCAGPNCVIHNPSEHALSDAPLMWRADTSTMERTCEHGVGHPDPDDIAFKASLDPEAGEWFGIHGCDGCCVKQNIELTSQKGNFMNQRWRSVAATIILTLAILGGAITVASCFMANPWVTSAALLMLFIWGLAIRFKTTRAEREWLRR